MKNLFFSISLILLCVAESLCFISPVLYAQSAIGQSPLNNPPLGHWEVIHRINYSTISKANLKGNISPAYLVYAVSMAGFHTRTFGLTVGPDDDVRYTRDGGKTWIKTSNSLFCRHGMDIVNKKVAWHCGNGGTRVSKDGCRTWKTVAASARPYMSFLDAQTGWTASPFKLLATIDGGKTWKEVALPEAAKLITAIALRTARHGYLLDTTGNLFVTTDGGQSWGMHSLGLKAGENLSIVLRYKGQF